MSIVDQVFLTTSVTKERDTLAGESLVVQASLLAQKQQLLSMRNRESNPIVRGRLDEAIQQCTDAWQEGNKLLRLIGYLLEDLDQPVTAGASTEPGDADQCIQLAVSAKSAKKCRQCKKMKPLENFSFVNPANAKPKYRMTCRPCWKVYVKESNDLRKKKSTKASASK